MKTLLNKNLNINTTTATPMPILTEQVWSFNGGKSHDSYINKEPNRYVLM